MRVGLLDATWKTVLEYSGSNTGEVRWIFQRPTRIEGFEFDGKPRGVLLSVRCGVEEQLIAGPVAFSDIAQPYRAGAVVLSPAKGWKVRGLIFPALKIGQVFQVLTSRWREGAGIRPYGLEVLP